MTLKERITADLKAAMISGDTVRRDTIRSLRAAIIEMDKRGIDREMTPEEELSLLTSAVKRRKETIEQLTNANRPEMLEQERKELAIVMEYLPAQMDEAEIKETIATIIQHADGKSDFGAIMGAVMKELKGKADGAVVRRLVNEMMCGS